MAKSLELPVSLVVGQVALNYATLQTIQPGDFVALDHAGYDPKSHQGTVVMKLGSQPLFQALLKHNKIKLLDADVHTEEKIFMENLPPEKELETSSSHETEKDAAKVVQAAEEESSVNLKEFPLMVTVEIARFSMTLETLMKLEPGNFLELPVHPSQGVNLHVNGKKVGRAELVHLGEALGIRILELGK
jgi:flagellar motor switch protein FliN/FliY